MKSATGIIGVALALMATGPTGFAQSAGDSAPVYAPPNSAAPNLVQAPPPIADPPPAVESFGTTPPVPKAARLPRKEGRVARFFRTGTIARHVGRKTTTTLWVKGDEGVMITFSR